jgi:hypothetical protein
MSGDEKEPPKVRDNGSYPETGTLADWDDDMGGLYGEDDLEGKDDVISAAKPDTAVKRSNKATRKKRGV